MIWDSTETKAYKKLESLESTWLSHNVEWVDNKREKILSAFKKAKIEVSGPLAERIERAALKVNLDSANKTFARMQGVSYYPSKELLTLEEAAMRRQFVAGGIPSPNPDDVKPTLANGPLEAEIRATVNRMKFQSFIVPMAG